VHALAPRVRPEHDALDEVVRCEGGERRIDPLVAQLRDVRARARRARTRALAPLALDLQLETLPSHLAHHSQRQDSARRWPLASPASRAGRGGCGGLPRRRVGRGRLRLGGGGRRALGAEREA